MAGSFAIVVPVADSDHEGADGLIQSLVEQQGVTVPWTLVFVGAAGALAAVRRTVSRLEDPPFAVRFVEPPSPTGRASARDAGWRSTDADVVVFLDLDMIPGPRWLSAYERAFAAPVDVVSGVRLHIDGADHAADESWTSLRARARVGHHPGVFASLEASLAAICKERGPLAPYGLLASNVAVRRPALKRTPGFNIALDRFDDLELGFRLWEAGATFGYCPEAEAIHTRPGAPSWQSTDEMTILFCRHPFAQVLWVHLWALSDDPSPLVATDFADPKLHDQIQGRLAQVGITLPLDFNADIDELRTLLVRVERFDAAVVDGFFVRAVREGLYSVASAQASIVRLYDSELLFRLLMASTSVGQQILRQELGTAFAGPRGIAAPGPMSCKGQYRLLVQRGLLARVPPIRVSLATPIAHGPQQKVVVTASRSPSLQAAIDKSRGGLLVNVPFSSETIGGTDELAELCFEFSLEIVPQSRATDVPNPKTDLALPHGGAGLDRARRLAAELARSHELDTAEAVVEMMDRMMSYGVLPARFPYHATLSTGTGVCLHQVQTQVLLLRLLGIPARQACGALLPPGGEDEPVIDKRVRSSSWSPFRHAWTEAFIESEAAWVPIERRSYGLGTVNDTTVPDPDTAAAIRHAVYKRYPFGTIDPYRLIASPRSAMLALMTPPEGVDRAALAPIFSSCFHEIKATFSRT